MIFANFDGLNPARKKITEWEPIEVDQMITVTYCILQITLVKYAYLFVAYRIGVGKNDRLRIVK